MAKKKVPAWIWIGGILAVILLWVASAYNGLVSKEGAVDNAWAQVETQYQRRADLVPQLVATVEGAADFEKSTIVEVTEARTNWLNSQANPNATIEQQIAASNSFDSALARLLVTVENYPTVTATANFQTLQAQLEGTENRVAVARKDYNDAATTYNITIKRVPTVVIANLFGFDAHGLFESQEGSENAPEVEFDFGS